MKNQMSIAEQWARMDPNWVEPVDTKGPTPRRVRQPAIPNYNLRVYGDAIREQIPGIRTQDLKWLANKSAKIYRRLKDNCVNNYRVCKVVGGKTTIDYEMRRAQGCCGFYDEQVFNPETHSRFSIGFNYGH